MLEDPYEHDQQPQRATISPYWALVAILLGVVLAMAFWSSGVRADPIATASAENNAVITLYNEPCDIKDQVTNLPMRATWVEGGKTFKGCFGVRPDNRCRHRIF